MNLTSLANILMPLMLECRKHCDDVFFNRPAYLCFISASGEAVPAVDSSSSVSLTTLADSLMPLMFECWVEAKPAQERNMGLGNRSGKPFSVLSFITLLK